MFIINKQWKKKNIYIKNYIIIMKNQVNKRNYIAALLLHEEPHEQVVLIINYIQIKFYKMFYSFFRRNDVHQILYKNSYNLIKGK